jgi:hypothetical protein
MGRFVLAAFDLIEDPRSEMLRFASRLLAALAVASAAIVLVPIVARSQQAAAPATTAPVSPEIRTPANHVTAGGQLEKVTVTGYLVPHVGGGPQPVYTIEPKDLAD